MLSILVSMIKEEFPLFFKNTFDLFSQLIFSMFQFEKLREIYDKLNN